jgi:hypothetical protein
MAGPKTGGWPKVTNNEMPGLGSGPVSLVWLFVVTGAVLISPYPTRDGGPIGEEAVSIMAMQRRLQANAVTVSIDHETGWVEAHTMPVDVLKQEASRLTTVRLRRLDSAA